MKTQTLFSWLIYTPNYEKKMKKETFIVEKITEDDIIYAKMKGKNSERFALNWRKIVSDLRQKEIKSSVTEYPLKTPCTGSTIILSYDKNNNIENAEIIGSTFRQHKSPTIFNL